MFQCGVNAEDSIEHYCCCDVVKQVMRRRLKLDPYYFANLHTFTLCNIHITTTEDLATVALLIYGFMCQPIRYVAMTAMKTTSIATVPARGATSTMTYWCKTSAMGLSTTMCPHGSSTTDGHQWRRARISPHCNRNHNDDEREKPPPPTTTIYRQQHPHSTTHY